jgi:hypothetical protein
MCVQSQGIDARPLDVNERFGTDVKCLGAASERLERGFDIFGSANF